MTTYVALLRGVNVGGRHRVSMQDLRELLAGLGAADVRTYLQSGNAVFRAGEPVEAVGAALEERLRSSLGVNAPVLLRSGEQLARIVEGNPFLEAVSDPAALHVTFLAESPAAERLRRLAERRFDLDELRAVDTELYLRCPHGYGRSKLGNAFLERELLVTATTRNWKTVTALAELASA